MIQTSTLAPTVESMSQRLTAVEQQVSDLQLAVSRLKERRNGNASVRLSLDDPAVEIARRIAAEMFGGEVDVALECDPENPDDEFVAFDVRWRGEPRELVRMRHEWHDRSDRATGDRSREFRLSIHPV
jgi:hypothetical protein